MAKDKQKSESLCTALMVFAVILTALSCYWQLAPLLAKYGYSNKYVNMAMLMYKEYFSEPLKLKSFILVLICCSSAFRIGKKIESNWSTILLYSVVGILLFLICPKDGIIYTLTSFTGMFFSIYGMSLIFRKLKDNVIPDEDEGFKQNERLIETKDSVNIPFTYVWKGKERKGWANCINPYRATCVLGSPGSGKSFAIYNAFIEQQIRKGFTFYVYDFKFPDLTERVLTEIAYQRKHENLWEKMKVKPHLYIINFDDPMKSNRCNPIHHSYITDPADTSEIADLVFKNINKGTDGKGFDFFNESAKVLLDADIWELANYDPDAVYNTPEGIEWVREHRGQEAVDALSPEVTEDLDGTWVIDSTTDYVNKGKLCTFPHVIEMMAYNYTKVFQILQFTRGLEAKISPFAGALESGAMEQLSGQIASAQIPLGKFVSPALYWVMSGNDFTLDINNPNEPKIVCMGNNPDRQTIYGTTLALYTARMFKLINHKHKLPSSILLDEIPTIFIKGIDQLIATARSNRVSICWGAQDKSQMRRDYGEKEAEVIFTTTGNCFAGSVEGKTAEDISKNFGKEYRKRIDQTINEDSESQTIRYQFEDILPASKIVDLPQGTFCGWVKDNFGETISRKKFCGAITVDMKRNDRLAAEAQKVPIITNMFGDTMPGMPEKDRDRLGKQYPKIADKEDELYKKYINELVQLEVNKNFNKIKQDIKTFIEKEYERTTPMAEKYKAEHGIEQ